MKSEKTKNNNVKFLNTKVLTNLKITHKLVVIFALTAILPLLFVGIYSKYAVIKLSTYTIEKSMRQTVHSIAINIESVFASMNRDMYYFTNVPSVQGIIKIRENEYSDSTQTMLEWKSDLKNIFVSIMYSKQIYQSI